MRITIQVMIKIEYERVRPKIKPLENPLVSFLAISMGYRAQYTVEFLSNNSKWYHKYINRIVRLIIALLNYYLISLVGAVNIIVYVISLWLTPWGLNREQNLILAIRCHKESLQACT